MHLITKRYEVSKNAIYKASLDDSMEVDELKRISKKIIKNFMTIVLLVLVYLPQLSELLLL